MSNASFILGSHFRFLAIKITFFVNSLKHELSLFSTLDTSIEVSFSVFLTGDSSCIPASL